MIQQQLRSPEIAPPVGRKSTFADGRYVVFKSLSVSFPKRQFEVLLAYDWSLRQTVVLKTVTTEQPASDDAVTQLTREASYLQQLNGEHQLFPRLLDTFYECGMLVLVIEYIRGETLWDWIHWQTCTIPLATVLQIGWQVAGMLDNLHTRTRPLIHRDLKPLNLMVSQQDRRLVLIDFGNARSPDATSTEWWTETIFPPPCTMDTFPNIGTLGFAPPEQLFDAHVAEFTGKTTPASDIYSLGALLHFLLSREDPTQRPLASIFAFSSLRHMGHVPDALATLIEAMLSHTLEQRPSAKDVRLRLRDIALAHTQQTSQL